MALAGTSSALAQETTAPLGLDPAVSGQGTSLLIGIGAAALSDGGRRANSTIVSLPRGMRFDGRSRERLCSRTQAARGGCPKASKIGFGRSVVSVAGFLAPGGETEVAWSLAAYLGKPERSTDVASIVLRADLLGADRVTQLLQPYLGAGLPAVSVSAARVVALRSGAYGLEIRFGTLPGEVPVPSSMTAKPTRFELALNAARRVRQDFVRHLRVRTLGGYRVEKVPDHRLVGYDLLRNPSDCRTSWRLELRTSFPSGVRRSPQRITCADERE